MNIQHTTCNKPAHMEKLKKIGEVKKRIDRISLRVIRRNYFTKFSNELFETNRK